MPDGIKTSEEVVSICSKNSAINMIVTHVSLIRFSWLIFVKVLWHFYYWQEFSFLHPIIAWIGKKKKKLLISFISEGNLMKSDLISSFPQCLVRNSNRKQHKLLAFYFLPFPLEIKLNRYTDSIPNYYRKQLTISLATVNRIVPTWSPVIANATYYRL